MKIATYNVNGVNGRLPVLLRWLEEARPDVVCLQELKAPDERFPIEAIEQAGYGAIWQGQKSWNGVAILARGTDPIETRRGVPGNEDDPNSRYIEAAVGGIVVGCLYLPNGNPAPGPKFDYKLEWFARFTAYAKSLLDSDFPVVLAGDYNVMPTDLDVYKPERWQTDALFRPEVREAFRTLVAQGWTDALRNCIRASASTRSGTIFEMRSAVMQVCASIICSLLQSSLQSLRELAWTAMFVGGRNQATMLPLGSSWTDSNWTPHETS